LRGARLTSHGSRWSRSPVLLAGPPLRRRGPERIRKQTRTVSNDAEVVSAARRAGDREACWIAGTCGMTVRHGSRN